MTGFRIVPRNNKTDYTKTQNNMSLLVVLVKRISKTSLAVIAAVEE